MSGRAFLAEVLSTLEHFRRNSLSRFHSPNIPQLCPKSSESFLGWLGTTLPQPGARAPTRRHPSALRPRPLGPKRRAVPLRPDASRVCGEGPVLPASFCTAPFPLPSEFQVNGSRRVEAAIPLLLPSVHLPLSASSGGGGGTPRRAGRNAE